MKWLKFWTFKSLLRFIFQLGGTWKNGLVLTQNVIAIFTDGSKKDLGVQAGIFSTFNNMEFSFKLKGECTGFQAEMYGMLKAADLMSDISGKDISIYIDSQAAINFQHPIQDCKNLSRVS